MGGLKGRVCNSEQRSVGERSMWVRMEKAGEWVGGRDFYTVVFFFFVDSSPRTSFLHSSETQRIMCARSKDSNKE